MSEVEKVYTELEEASNYLNCLGLVNHYSLNTPEKKLNWDINYKKALDRFSRAYQAKEKLVNSKIENKQIYKKPILTIVK